MKRVNIFLTDKQITGLKKLSKKTGLSVAELVRRLIDERLSEKKPRGRKC